MEFCTHPTKNPVTCRQQQMELQAVTQGCVHHHRGVLHPMELTREVSVPSSVRVPQL